MLQAIARRNEIRRKLYQPANAVPDLGIDLKRPKTLPVLKLADPEPIRQPVDIGVGQLIPLYRVIYPKTPMPPLTVERIQKAVCADYGVTFLDLVSHRRNASIVFPRQVAVYLCRKLTTRSMPEIGRRFGDRDHTTVLHAFRKIEALRQVDPDLNARLNALTSLLTPIV